MLIVLVIGITTVNNFDKMKAVQNSLETLSETVGGGQADAKTRTETAETAKNNAKEASGTVKKAEGTTTSETSDGQLSDQDFYVVQKGETLAGISQKLYGDTSHVKAICKMNGLSDGNLIYIGQNYYSHKCEMWYTRVHSIRRNVERMTDGWNAGRTAISML